MKKEKRLIYIGMIFVFVGAFITSCTKEGPKGESGTASCTECHGTSLNLVENQFYQSGHYAGVYSLERIEEGGWSASCSRCHSSEGFLQYVETGEASAVATPGKWECKTCHAIHETFTADDFTLRLTAPVAWNISSDSVDFGGSSNLCANCHQARTAEPNTATPGETFKISNTHYGPHHGPQANIVYGYGFAEIAGAIAYPADGSHQHFKAGGCSECHMGDYADGTGGHTWTPNVATCNACHATEDYNYNGLQTEVAGLLDELAVALAAKGVMSYDSTSETYNLVTGTFPMVQAQAYYNYIGIEEDRSLGVHNPNYVLALLKNSIAALE